MMVGTRPCFKKIKPGNAFTFNYMSEFVLILSVKNCFSLLSEME